MISLKDCKYLWTYCFIIVILMLNVLGKLEILSILFLLYFLYKLLGQSYRATLIFALVISGIVLIFYYKTAKLDLVTHLNFNHSEPLTLISYPLNIEIEESIVKGQGSLITPEGSNIKCQFTYFAEELDQELQSKLGVKPVKMQVIAKVSPIPSARNFDVFDYQTYLKGKDIVWQIQIKSIQGYQVSHHQDYLLSFKLKFLEFIKKSQGNFWIDIQNKLFFNVDSAVYKSIKGNLAELGIIHFFAISGFHINYLIKKLDYLLRRLGWDPESNYLVIIPTLILYGWLVSWPIGAVRAIATYSFKKVYKSKDQSFSSMDQLSIIGIVLLFFNPFLVNDLGFLLSFFMTYIVKFYYQTQRHSIFETFELSITCLLASWPFLMQISKSWNPLQIFSLLLVTVLFEPIFMPIMVAIFLLRIFGFNYLDLFLEVIVLPASLEDILTLMENLFSSFALNIGQVFPLIYLCLSFVAIYWFYCLLRRRVYKGLMIVIGTYVLFSISLFSPRLVGKITIIDVDQGDAILIQPYFSNENWLIDTGGKLSFGEEGSHIKEKKFAEWTIIPALKALGVNHLTGLIISHADQDHIGNLAYLAEDFSIHKIYLNKMTSQELMKQAYFTKYKDLQVIVPSKQEIHLMNDQLQLFDLGSQEYQESNNHSLVTFLRLDEVSFLSMGDLSFELEEAFLRQQPQIKSSLVKLSHHGSHSSSSSAFLSQVGLKLALISVGQNNSYGHPSSEVLGRLENLRIPYLSTGQLGAIQIKIVPLFNQVSIDWVIQSQEKGD